MAGVVAEKEGPQQTAQTVAGRRQERRLTVTAHGQQRWLTAANTVATVVNGREHRSNGG